MIETEGSTQFTLGKQTNVRHMETLHSLGLKIYMYITPYTRISDSCVDFSLCSSLTQQRVEIQTATPQSNITENP